MPDRPLRDRLGVGIKQVMRRYWAAIEAKLQELVSQGVPLSDLALEHHPDMLTKITVCGQPVAQFRITYPASAQDSG